ncbi:hypothetical protein R52603_05419 [Paraburkholderia saeva]|uniref:Uncharacterized protein n=2 Tax=Paraburkholderia saeva TaxID=2777537 RepID=A0A9N8S317_9BURK|nr:hypothetical protein R52603_05419 [Paraburkholderia saeva]CAG4927303.1 hypothetical protein R70241_05575 [Paraburkholderia saeva]CAG4927407.1 hypothetical protein LMG31841_05688 [Paraburkholderia saeva]
MQKTARTISPMSATQSDFALTQKARVAAIAKADNDRAQKRQDNDARIDVNAGKWRYVCQKD